VVQGVAVVDFAVFGMAVVGMSAFGMAAHSGACGERRARAAQDAACFTIGPHLETDPMGLVPMVKQVCG
jgi:hypothetical protein